MANKILSDEEIKDKILSLDIAKECYAYYYKILYDKYLQLLKCHQSEAYYEKKSRNQTIIIRECTKYIDDQKARIKELENKLKFCEYDNRIKLHETWYWMGDGEDHLESLTCPVIINANDLRDLISQARADQNKKIGEWLVKNDTGNMTCYVQIEKEIIAKLEKGEEVGK